MAELNTILTIPEGETIFGPVQLPVQIRCLTFRADRLAWPDNRAQILCSWKVELSEDAQLWVPQAEGSTHGGVFTVPFTAQTISFKTPVPANTWTRVVVQVTEPLTTRVTMTWQ